MRAQLVSICIACMAANAGAAAVLSPQADRQIESSSTREIIDPSRSVHRLAATTSVSLAARSDYQATAGLSKQYRSIAATAQLRFALPSPRYSASVVFEYSAIEHRSDTAILGAIVAYKAGDWSLSFAPYISKASDRSGVWKQQSTARYRISRRSAVGLELIGSLTRLGASKLLVGYYGKISDTMSVTLTVGSGLDTGPDVAVRSAVIWRLR